MCRCEENLGPAGRFSVLDGSGRELYEGGAPRIDPADVAGPWHYGGDFTALHEAGGDFRIRFEAGNQVATSDRFGLGSKILWRLAKPLVLHMLRTSRASAENHRDGSYRAPGTLRDDGTFYDVGGGWFDGGDTGGTSLRYGLRALLGLTFARQQDVRDPQIDAEIRHGADWLRRLMITYPSSGAMVSRTCEDGTLRLLGDADEANTVELGVGFAFAKISEALGDVDLLRRGVRFWRKYRDAGGPDERGARLLTAVALHVTTLEPGYLAAAEREAEELVVALDERAEAEERDFPEGDVYTVAALSEFAASDPQNPLTPRVKLALGRYLDSRVECCRQDAFGLTPLPRGAGAADEPLCRAEQAWAALSAYRVTGRTSYVELACNALNWMLGLNSGNVSLVRGAGVNSAGEHPADAPHGAVVPLSPDVRESARLGCTAAFLMALSLL